MNSAEVFTVTRPKLKHTLIQRHLRRLFESLAEPGTFVESELAFRALPEHELRVADVAYVSSPRWARADPDDSLHDAPDWSSRSFPLPTPQPRSMTKRSCA